MGRGKRKNGGAANAKKRPIDRYEHTGKKRINNPPVGLVTPETDPPLPTHKVYDYIQPVPEVKPGKELNYDPHLDPQLVWAGKKEHASVEVHTVSLHVHETIDPRTIIEAVRKRNGNGLPVQPSLFERPEENLPLRDAIDFYKHAHGWSNRLIACPYRKFCVPHGGCLFSKRTESSSGLTVCALLESGERNSPMRRCNAACGFSNRHA